MHSPIVVVPELSANARGATGDFGWWLVVIRRAKGRISAKQTYRKKARLSARLGNHRKQAKARNGEMVGWGRQSKTDKGPLNQDIGQERNKTAVSAVGCGLRWIRANRTRGGVEYGKEFLVQTVARVIKL